MTETLTGKQVLALLAQDEVPEIELLSDDKWVTASVTTWQTCALRNCGYTFRIKPAPQRRLSVTLASGEVVSWPEPVRKALKGTPRYWFVVYEGELVQAIWTDHAVDMRRLAFGNVHLTREAAQEHADALRKINTQGVA